MDILIIAQWVGFVSLVMSIGGVIYTYGSNRGKPAQEVKDELLPRIVQNEKNLTELLFKMDLFWNVVEQNFPKWLRQECTPELDILLDRADADPKFVSFTRQELHNLLDEINKDIHRSTITEDSGRLMALSFYRVVVVSKLGKQHV